MRKYVIASLLVAGMVTRAFAAEYFVAQSATTHKCSVTSTKPDGKSMSNRGTRTLGPEPERPAAESRLKARWLSERLGP